MTRPADDHTTSPELLPCPFCGHPESISHDRYLTRLAYVECLGCSTHGPAKDHELGAIAAWNTRQPQSPSTSLSDEALIEHVGRAMHPSRWQSYDAQIAAGQNLSHSCEIGITESKADARKAIEAMKSKEQSND